MALSPRAAPTLVLALAALAACDGFGAREAGAYAQLQAQPGEAWLYAYSNDTANAQSTLLMIDPDTGAATPIGAPIAGSVEALAFDDAARVLYGAWRPADPLAPSELVTIDWHTGAVTPVAPLLTVDPNTPSDAWVQGMSFAPDGTLLALTHDPERLVAIDPHGDFHHLVDLGFPLDAYATFFVGPDLYVVDADGQDVRIIAVDSLTGAGQQLVQLPPGASSVGAATDDDGTVHVVLDDELHRLDALLVPSFVADTGWADLGALAWIAEPGDATPSLEDACPCDADWKNHGQYVSCVAAWANEYAPSGQHGQVVSQAARSDCGK